jgi:hypothetical protein
MAIATKGRINFVCPAATVQLLEEMAEADHRTKSSLMNKIVDFYLQHHAPNGQPKAIMIEAKPTTHSQKKAGAR